MPNTNHSIHSNIKLWESVNVAYPFFLIGQPTVTSLQRVTSSTSFTLNCTSTGSPASAVMWSKDGTLLHITDSYQTTQIMADGGSATYYNLLTVNSEPQDLLGTYGCSVLNTIGVSNVATISVEGMCTLELGLRIFIYTCQVSI